MIGRKDYNRERSWKFLFVHFVIVLCYSYYSYRQHLSVSTFMSEKAMSGEVDIILSNFFYGDMPKTFVFTSLLPITVNELKLASVTINMLWIIWCEFDFSVDVSPCDQKKSHSYKVFKWKSEFFSVLCSNFCFLLLLTIKIIVICNQSNFPESPDI